MSSEQQDPLIVIPPPEIRKILDKTAHFVARNGPSFEERIKENEKMNNKFSFLNGNDPYRAYYDKRVKEFKEGTADVQSKKTVASTPVAPAPIVKPPPKEPKPLNFLIDTPPIPVSDYELIKLTALFVARNGRNFMNTLSKKEARNFQFDFLKSNHALFSHFTRLVEMYAKVLNPKKDVIKDLERFMESKYNALEDIYSQVAYQRHKEETARMEKEKVEVEKAAFASIDWHDFVVVETIEFTVADSESNLPSPMTIKSLENLNILQKQAERIFDEIDAVHDKMEIDGQVPSKAAPPKGPPPKVPEIPVPVPESEPREEIVSTTKKIRTDYVSKVGKIGVAEPTQICPRCGIAVKVSEMEDHVRIELLDPKWRQQKAIYESRIKDSNLVLGTENVSKNLSRLSDYRSDIFGSEVSEDSKKLIEQEKKISAEKSKTTWDGNASSAPKAIKKAQSNIESAPGKIIGPQIPSLPGSMKIPPIPKIPTIPPLPGSIRHPSLPVNIPPPPKPVAPPPSSQNGGSIAPPLKKQKQDEPPPEGLLWESDFLSKYSGPLNIQIRTLDGSFITLDGLALTSTVNSIKDKIASQVGIAASKLKLLTSSGTAMRNAMTLAYYNVVTGSVLSLAKK